MSQEAAVPPDLWAEIDRRIAVAVGQALRAAPLRNASISGGEGLTVEAGSKIRIEHPDGRTMLRAGVYDVNHDYDLPDGSRQPMFLLYRQDGTSALAMYDPVPDPGTPGGYQQFLALYDRGGQIAMSDDTSSGTGLARPYVPIPVTPSRYTDMVAVTDAAFVDVFETPGLFHKVNARARADIRCTTDLTGTTGEVRVLVDGVQVGTTQTVGFTLGTAIVGPFAMPGAAYTTHQVKVQARRTAGTGAVRLAAALWGVQT